MGLATSAQSRSESREARRNPAACAALTIAVAAVFWAGLIWAAVRIFG